MTGRVITALASRDGTTDLDRLLGESATDATARRRSAYDQLAGEEWRAPVLFGAGRLGRKILAGLRARDMAPAAFVDNDAQRWGEHIDGLEVLEPARAAERYGVTHPWVVTIWSPGHRYLHTRGQLADMGCTRILPFQTLLWKHPDALLPHYFFEVPEKILAHASDLRRVFDLLADDPSRRELVAQLAWRLRLDYAGMSMPAPAEQYFAAGVVVPDDEERLVDCGAFDGDTIRQFLAQRGGRFGDIVAFEPDPGTFERLSRFVAELPGAVRPRVRVRHAAVGGAAGLVRFDAAGGMQSAVGASGGTTVACVTLDDELRDSPATLLKFDIEGSELSALQGAAHSIARDRPVLAVCVDHRPEDLWAIPLHIASLHIEYRYALRSHGDDGFDSVFYAVPPVRAGAELSR